MGRGMKGWAPRDMWKKFSLKSGIHIRSPEYSSRNLIYIQPTLLKCGSNRLCTFPIVLYFICRYTHHMIANRECKCTDENGNRANIYYIYAYPTYEYGNMFDAFAIYCLYYHFAILTDREWTILDTFRFELFEQPYSPHVMLALFAFASKTHSTKFNDECGEWTKKKK